MTKEPYDYDTIRQVSVESRKDIPIRKDNKEKKEYIRNELNELAMSENGWDKIRYKILLANI